VKVLKHTLNNENNLQEVTKHLEYERLLKQSSSFRELKSIIVSLTTSGYSQTPQSWHPEKR